MWISTKIFDLLSSNRDEVVKLRTERDSYRDELSRANILNDFFRLQINSLQMERQQLLDKAYGVKVPAPQIEKAPLPGEPNSIDEFSFDDVGDEVAKKLGLPVYN